MLNIQPPWLEDAAARKRPSPWTGAWGCSSGTECCGISQRGLACRYACKFRSFYITLHLTRARERGRARDSLTVDCVLTLLDCQPTSWGTQQAVDHQAPLIPLPGHAPCDRVQQTKSLFCAAPGPKCPNVGCWLLEQATGQEMKERPRFKICTEVHALPPLRPLHRSR